jgi:His-Xaa-Ser system protein HxsD
MSKRFRVRVVIGHTPRTRRMRRMPPTLPITRRLSSVNGSLSDPANRNLDISTRIYSVEAIKKTAYRFADRASIVINPVGPDDVSVSFTFVRRNGIEPDQVVADFCNELLDQDLRAIIKRESTPLRNLILAHAFSRTSLASQG